MSLGNIQNDNSRAMTKFWKEKKKMKNRKLNFAAAGLILTLSLLNFTNAQTGGAFEIKPSVIAAGGGAGSNGSFTVNSTIGESLAGANLSGGSFSVSSGFWGGGASSVTPRRSPFDFDGDGRTDISIFRPGPGEWWYLRSSDGGNRAFQFGSSSDRLVPGDYTGDGRADIAFWRPATGFWFVLRSEDFSFFGFPFGVANDINVPGDYDGDGKFDAAVFRPSNATWYIERSTAGTAIVGFGLTGDTPVPSAFVR